MSRVLALAFCLASWAAAAGTLDAHNTVRAVVDDKAITHKDVIKRIDMVTNTLEKRMTLEKIVNHRAEIYSATLEGLLHEKLLLAEARRMLKTHEVFEKKLEAMVHTGIENARRKAGGDRKFREKLRKDGLTYEQHIALLREQLMRGVVLYQFVDRDFSVSPEEMRAYYSKHLRRFQEPPCARYRQIFIPLNEHTPRAAARQTADHVMGLLKKQHNFARLAQQYSDGPNAAKGGLWDFAGRGSRKGTRPEPIDKLIFSLPIGEAGGPVETPIGLTIIKVEARRKGRTIPYEEVQEALEKELIRGKRKRRYKKLIQRLEKEHYVKRMPQSGLRPHPKLKTEN